MLVRWLLALQNCLIKELYVKKNYEDWSPKKTSKNGYKGIRSILILPWGASAIFRGIFPILEGGEVHSLCISNQSHSWDYYSTANPELLVLGLSSQRLIRDLALWSKWGYLNQLAQVWNLRLHTWHLPQEMSLTLIFSPNLKTKSNTTGCILFTDRPR